MTLVIQIRSLCAGFGAAAVCHHVIRKHFTGLYRLHPSGVKVKFDAGSESLRWRGLLGYGRRIRLYYVEKCIF